MELQFKTQAYQTEAAEAVAEVFRGQPAGREEGGNRPLALPDAALLENIRRVQSRNGVPLSSALAEDLGRCSLDVEMETGTGKTYVYIKTIFELNRRYGWSRFIVAVPSIAIREGVRRTFDLTRDHFMALYGKKARFFVYSGRDLEALEGFAAQRGVSVMIINTQAFASSLREGGGAASRIIYSRRDEFASRRPIDIVRSARPIVILDEPQRMGGEATRRALQNFDPLFVLNYSATHARRHNLVYVLDALEAYRKKLVKRIEVKGFAAGGPGGGGRYLYLERIVLSPDRPPMARLEFEAAERGGVVRRTRALGTGDSLYDLSGGMAQYRGCVLADIDPLGGRVTLSDGQTLSPGEGAASEADLRRLQIRETILSHFEKERVLFPLGVKTLSLFFIDRVSGYRVYDADGREGLGEYGRIFQQEYENALGRFLTGEDSPYQRYLRRMGGDPARVHRGYFSVDRRTGRSVDSAVARGGTCSDDLPAYDLILSNRERLLSFEEPTRFIFSHSALREGWDNPNVFQICTLKHAVSQTMKRQEVGRGLRLCVNQEGVRMDEAACGAAVHDINLLTVVASESYEKFVSDLQREIRQDLPPGRTGENPENGRQARIEGNPLNRLFDTPEFQRLWDLLRRRYAYRVSFDSGELTERAARRIREELTVLRPQYAATLGRQREDMRFQAESTRSLDASPAGAPCDLVGRVAEGAALTRRTAAAILRETGREKLALFALNPEQFIAEAVRLIREQRAALAAEGILYQAGEGSFAPEIFSTEGGPLRLAFRAKKHIQDYVFTGGGPEGRRERALAGALDGAAAVRAYARLPRGWGVPTPLGPWAPEWAVALREGGGLDGCLLTAAGGAEKSPDLLVRMACVRRMLDQISGGRVRLLTIGPDGAVDREDGNFI